MSQPAPQRDALEFIFDQSTPWPVGLIPRSSQIRTFRLADTGEKVYLLGVNRGAGMRQNPNLHIAVFGFKPPKRRPNTSLLPKCQFGGLITGPDKELWCWAEGLTIDTVPKQRKTTVTLHRNGKREQFRPI